MNDIPSGYTLDLSASSPASFRTRARWARELGRADAFDDVMAVLDDADARLSPVRERREQQLAAHRRRVRVNTLKAMLMGLLVLLPLGAAVAYLAHYAPPSNVEARVAHWKTALSSLEAEPARANEMKQGAIQSPPGGDVGVFAKAE